MKSAFRRLASISLLLALVPQMAFADPITPTPLTPIPPGDDRIAPVSEGTAAPFSGQLFDARTATRWANYLQQCRMRLTLDVEYQRKLDAADLTLAQTRLELERTQYATVTEDLQRKLGKATEEAANPPFFRTAWFGLIMGIMATSLAVFGGAYAAHALR